MRPDIFTSVVVMSAPFAGPPGIADGVERSSEVDVHAELAKLRRLASTISGTTRLEKRMSTCGTRRVLIPHARVFSREEC